MNDTEERIIGCLLSRGSSIEEVYGVLSPEMFENAVYGKIYDEYRKAFEENKEPTLSELQQTLMSSGFREVEVQDSLLRAASADSLSYQISGHATALINHYKARTVDKILSRVSLQDADIDKQIDTLIADLDSLRGGKKNDGQTISEITEMYENDYFIDKEKSLVFIGEDQIDCLTGGLEGGDLVLVAARPSCGKSALATQWAETFAKQGHKVAYYNLEMQSRSCFERFVAAKSGIEITRLRRATRFHNDEKERYDRAIAELKQQSGITLYSGSKKVTEIRNDVQRTKPDIIIIDYLQLLICDNRYQGNRVAEVGQISHDLKAIAMRYDIPVLCLAQLSRSVEGRRDHRPILSDLRESGDLEQDASIVFFLYNCNEDDLTEKKLDVAKSRQGKLGTVELKFDGARLHFDLAENATPFD